MISLPPPTEQAFTLVELSIVLVILGLLVGGVVSGKSLVRAAENRAAIAQIQEYQTAARTFREKYFYLPGDLPDPQRTQMGYQTQSCWGCNSNGDGKISGAYGTQVDGETMRFWIDLAKAGLIRGSFNPIPWGGNGNLNVTGNAINGYLPASKLGGDQHIYIWNGGLTVHFDGSTGNWDRFGDNGNFITISGVSNLRGYNVGGTFSSNSTTTVMDAYAIDAKTDDGLPQTGNAQAVYIGTVSGAAAMWAGGTVAWPNTNPGTVAISPSATTCMDNNGIVDPTHYSTSQNNGANRTCSITFKLQ